MDYKLLPENWIIQQSFDMRGMPWNPQRCSVTLRNTKTTEAVIGYGDSEEQAYQDALEVAKKMRVY